MKKKSKKERKKTVEWDVDFAKEENVEWNEKKHLEIPIRNEMLLQTKLGPWIKERVHDGMIFYGVDICYLHYVALS